MPFTPLHMGPGILLKALLQGSFSLMVFGWTQIVMDLQPLYVMLSNTTRFELHGFSHTYLGATLLAVVSAVSGKYLSELALKLLTLSTVNRSINIGWRIAFFSAVLGTYSHVVLDSIMHADIQPYFPFAKGNHLLGWVDMTQLHEFCFYSGIAGGVIYYIVQIVRDLKETI
jgi:membrane-bound metal-dependent hydrolase YbcI (DUF457 family)